MLNSIIISFLSFLILIISIENSLADHRFSLNYTKTFNKLDLDNPNKLFVINVPNLLNRSREVTALEYWYQKAIFMKDETKDSKYTYWEGWCGYHEGRCKMKISTEKINDMQMKEEGYKKAVDYIMNYFSKVSIEEAGEESEQKVLQKLFIITDKKYDNREQWFKWYEQNQHNLKLSKNGDKLVYHQLSFPDQLNMHTPLSKWKEPRSFHTEFYEKYEDQINISRIKSNNNLNIKKVYSPNRAYWYSKQYGWEKNNDNEVTETNELPEAGYIYIFNERDYLTKITIYDNYINFRISENCINEKLLYIEIWWGRILGTYLIFDVEKEKVLQKEMIHFGETMYQQHKYHTKPDS